MLLVSLGACSGPNPCLAEAECVGDEREVMTCCVAAHGWLVEGETVSADSARCIAEGNAELWYPEAVDAGCELYVEEVVLMGHPGWRVTLVVVESCHTDQVMVDSHTGGVYVRGDGTLQSPFTVFVTGECP